MSRILKRPMFRKGGLSQETGIMSGLDRKGYAQGSYAPRVGYQTGTTPLSGYVLQGSRPPPLRGFTLQGATPIQPSAAGAVAKKTLMEGLGGKTKGALDFFRKGLSRARTGAGMARTGLGSLLSYAPAGASTPMAGGAVAGPALGIGAVVASPFVAHYAAKGQRKKGMFTPEGESYDPETGEILGGPNVSELFFTEQELASSKDELLQLQKEQISARIKRGDSFDANIAQELGVNTATGEIETDEDDLLDIPGGEKKLKGDMESNLMKAYKEYAPIFEKELGVSPEDTKKQLYMQLAKFGAGLAAQPGGDLVGAIGKAAEKPLEGAGEVVKDVSTAKRQAKLLALQTAISENQPGNVGKALKDIAKAYKVSMSEAADIYAKWQTNNTTALAADVRAYREFAADKGVNPEGFQRSIRKFLADPELADLVGKFNEKLPEDIEDATNKEYYITTQGELVRVVDGQILTSKDAGFKDKPKKK